MPDVTFVHVRTGVEYVVDARIFWNSMSEGPSRYTAYSHVGWGATHGEQQKRDSWSEAIRRRRDQSPFSRIVRPVYSSP